MKHLKLRSAAYLFLFLALTIPSEAQIRVMALGDAVVLGTGSSTSNVGGFRDDLSLFLNTSLMPFDFVGSLDDGVSADPHHEGHAGSTINEINQNLSAYLQQFNPHIVLIHIGTEELRDNANVNSVVNDLTSTINLISSYSSETEIFLASIIPSKNSSVNLNINSLNFQLQTLAQNKKAEGIRINFVDINNTFQLNPNWQNAYMSDDYFPNDTGYGILAQVFFSNINSLSKYVNLQTFSDNFNNRFLLGPNWSTHPRFQIIGNELENGSTDAVWDKHFAIVNSIPNANSISFKFSPNADDLGVAESGTAILLDKASIDANGYLVTVNSGLLRFWSLIDGGIDQNLKNIPVTLPMPKPGDIFSMTWQFNDQTLIINVFINNTPFPELQYNITPPGENEVRYTGVMLRGDRNNNIDDFVLSNFVDTSPPAQVTDLILVGISSSVAHLRFTTTGDDSLTDKAQSYDIRYSTDPINEANFSQAIKATVLQEPALPGTIENISISGLTKNIKYYFAIKIVDDNRNESGLSNVVSGTTKDAIYFLEQWNRENIGDQWQTTSDIEIGNESIRTTNNQAGWQSYAFLKAPNSPFEMGFQWVNVTQTDDIDDVGILINLDNTDPTANGVMIVRNTSNREFQLWMVIQGIPTQLIDSLTDGFPNPISGSILKVFSYTEDTSIHFAVFVNNVYYGTLTDASELFLNNPVQFCGLIFQGNSNIAVDNFFTYSPFTTPAELSKLSGDEQTGSLSQVLDRPLEVKVTDESGQPVYFGKVEFDIVSGNASLLPPSHPDGFVFVEAENGILSSPMARLDDPLASGGQYIETPPDSAEGGVANYTFYIPQDGVYSFWGRVIATSGTDDSFFITVDDNEEIVWDVLQRQYQSNWTWDQISARGESGADVDPWTLSLNKGLHTLVVKRRDAGAKLDRLIITKDPLFVPFELGGQAYYASDFSGISKAYIRIGTSAGDISVRAKISDLPGSDVFFNLHSIPNPPVEISEVSGNNQIGTAGFPLPQPFVVLVQDEFGNPVENVEVNFEIIEGDGSLQNPGTVLTNSSGKASVILVMSKNSAENRVLAKVDGLIGSPVEFSATANSGIATKIEYVSGSNQTTEVGLQLPAPLEVRVLDAQGNPMPSFPILFEISSNLGGSLSADSVFSDTNGIARVNFTLGIVTGEYTIHARADGLVDSPVLFSVTAIGASAFGLVKVSGDSASGVSSFPLTTSFVVKVVDRFGNGVEAEEVLFRVKEGGGIFDGGQTEVTKTTNSVGMASVVLVLGNVIGDFNNRVEAIKVGLNGSPVEFVATSLAPTAFKLEIVDGNNQLGIINEPLDLPFRVRVTNPIDQPIKNHPVIFQVTAGSGIFVETIDITHIVATNDSGIASTVLRIGPGAGNGVNEVQATGFRGNLPLVGSPVVFHASAKFEAVKIQVLQGNNQLGLINTTLFEPLEVLVLDSEDKPVSGIPVEFLVSTGGGTLDSNQDTFLVKTTNISGKASVVFALGNESGFNNNTVTVTASDGFQLLQGAPITFYATAANSPASKLESLTQSQLTGVVGDLLSDIIRIKVNDNSNQPVTEHDVEFRILSGNGKIVGSAIDTFLVKQTNEIGIVEIQWILGTTAGTNVNQLQVSSENGITALNNSPIIFSVTAVHTQMDPDSSTINVTSPVIADGQDKAEVTVTLLDKYNNPIPGKTVELSIIGQLNFIEQPNAVTDETGQTVGYLTSIKSGVRTVHARDITDSVDLNSFAVVEFISNTASRIKLTSGSAQTRNTGTVLVDPLVVSITDKFDNPIPNYQVTFSAKTEGGSFIEDQPVYTDSSGLAFVNYILSATDGINIIEANADNLEDNPVLFSATGIFSTADKIIAISGDSQTGMVSDTLTQPLVIQILDATENPLRGAPIDFVFTAGSGRFVESMPVFTDAYGKASVKPILGSELITQVIFVTSKKLPGIILTFFANTLPSNATQISIHSGDNQSILPLKQSRLLQVITRDAFNNLVPGEKVLFEVIEGDATIITEQPVVSNNLGLSSIVVQARTSPGVVKIAASLISNSSEKVVFVLQVLSAEVHNLILVSGDQQIGTKGYFLSEPLVVKVTDIYNNPIPGEPVSFVVSNGEATVLGNSIKLTNEEGLAQCQLNIGKNATQIEVFALVASLPGVVLTYHITAIQNEIPLLVSDTSDLQVLENEYVGFNISVIDPDGDQVSVETSDPPVGAVFTKVNAVSWRFDWTPTFEQSGKYPIIYSVSDQRGGIVSDTVQIEVINVNRLPLITHFQPDRDTTLIQGRQIEFSVEILDPDGDELSVFWQQNDQVVSNSTSFLYESNPNFSGEDIIEVFVSDGQDTVNYRWIITVAVSVELVQFNAQFDAASNSVLLQWTTKFESDNMGFDITRSTQREVGYQKVNPRLIPANPIGIYEFLDGDVTPVFRYYYKLLDKSIHGVTSEHGPIQVWFELPSDFQLDQNYPNPLAINIGQTSTVIQFRIPSKEAISIIIFNALGQQILTLADKLYEPGIYQVTWDGKDYAGKLVPSGIYFYELSAGSHRQIKQMILIR